MMLEAQRESDWDPKAEKTSPTEEGEGQKTGSRGSTVVKGGIEI